MREQISNYIRAGYPGIYIVSPEEKRVEAELQVVAGSLGYNLLAWSATGGLVDTAEGRLHEAHDPLEAVEAVDELPESSIILLRDFHLFLEDGNPVLIRALKDALAAGKTKGKVLVMLGCRQVLPPELEREMFLLEFKLPDKNRLGSVLDAICVSAGLEAPAGDKREEILDAATGLTCTEAENAYALAVIEAGRVDARVVAREKAAGLKKNGLVEVVSVDRRLDDIGGLDILKEWLLRRREAFGQRAMEYHLPAPKGLLLIGVPGCGKSLTAKASAAALERPLLKLDAGRLFGGLVGESEANLRSAIEVAEAVSPCVLWLDEIEKGFSGSQGSGVTDGGTSARVLGSFLSWLQEKTAPVFVVATANDVARLPPEMLRKGRWDEIVFIDLPDDAERRAIWEIQIRKHHRDPGQYRLDMLSGSSNGFTGAEIEQAFIEALYHAFMENREPGNDDIAGVLAETVPLCRMMAERIRNLRSWSQGRARAASRPREEPDRRRIVA